MAMKLAVLALAVFTIVSASEKMKRQSGPNFEEYFNQFQEQMKPIMGGFPTLPNGFGSFPNFPGMGGGSSSGSQGGSSQFKRQINPNTVNEWFSHFQENGNNFSGNLPFKPPTLGQFPFGGSSSSGSSESSQNESS